MFQNSEPFSGFAVDDIDKAKEFYEKILDMNVENIEMGLLQVDLGGKNVLIYPKDDHTPAEFTILNFPVKDINAAVDQLTERGVTMERYKDFPVDCDAKGIYSGAGPNIAWFKDPAGNVLSVLEMT